MATFTKRTTQDGTVRWGAQVYAGRHPATGKPQFVTKTFDREKAAQVWAGKQEGQRDDGYRPATNVTLATYLRDTWLPSYRTQVRSPYNMEKTLGRWVLNPPKALARMPALGSVQLRRLTVDHLDRFYAAMDAWGQHERTKGGRGIAARGITHLHGLLKRALKAAVRKGELPRNPAEFATLPKADVRAEITTEADEASGAVRALTRDQATRFLAEARTDRYAALWYVLLTGGLRPGEAFALKWRHVDFEHGMVQVRATLTRLGVDKRTQGWKLTKPKTDTSRRDVPLPDVTLRELRRWKKQQAEGRLQLGPEWQDHDFVFTTEFGTPLGNNMGRLWERLTAAAELGDWGDQPAKPRSGPTAHRPFRPAFCMYALRHTCATLLLLDGVDLLEVSRRLGHTDLAFTARTYGHVKAEHGTKSAAAFDRLFGT